MKLIVSAVTAIFLACSDVLGGELFTQDASCDLEPNFDVAVAPQIGTSPFVIELSSVKYEEGENITITIHSKSGDPFINAIVRSRCLSCSTPRTDLGTYSMVDERLQTFDCGGITESVVTAAGYKDKNQLKIYWTPNPSVAEDLLFEASVIVTMKEWWTNLESETLVPVTQPTEQGSLCSDSTSNRSEHAYLSLMLVFYLIM